jgi:hypothetical protein
MAARASFPPKCAMYCGFEKGPASRPTPRVQEAKLHVDRLMPRQDPVAVLPKAPQRCRSWEVERDPPARRLRVEPGLSLRTRKHRQGASQRWSHCFRQRPRRLRLPGFSMRRRVSDGAIGTRRCRRHHHESAIQDRRRVRFTCARASADEPDISQIKFGQRARSAGLTWGSGLWAMSS